MLSRQLRTAAGPALPSGERERAAGCGPWDQGSWSGLHPAPKLPKPRSLALWRWAGRKKVRKVHSPVMGPRRDWDPHPGSLLDPGQSCQAGHHRALPFRGLHPDTALAGLAPGLCQSPQAFRALTGTMQATSTPSALLGRHHLV